MPPRSSVRTAELALLAMVVVWGVNIPVMKVALRDLHPLVLSAVRLTLSALTLGVLALREQRPATKTAWPRVVWAALLGNGLYQILFVIGLQRTSGGNTALLISASPVWTALLAWLCAIERLRPAAWAGLVLAFAGATAITGEGARPEVVESDLIGDLLILGSGLAWAGFTIISKPLLATMSPTRLAFLVTALPLPIHLALGAPYFGELAHLRAPVAIAVAYSGVLSTGLAYVWWNLAVDVVGPSHASNFNNLIPVVALTLSWTLLGEDVRALQVLGGALVLTGVVVMRRARQRATG